MEPAARAAPTVMSGEAQTLRVVDRVSHHRPAGSPPDRARVIRVLAVLAMALLPWLVAPGEVQPDTKIDLTLSPWTYLARSVDAWNGHAGLGELQNQAYGYLFPMGPVFGIGHSLGLPAWACQRVWWTILLLVAFLGVQRLVRELRLAGPSVALLAAAAYALCPRVLTLLAENSSEAWPMAVAPWLVLAARPLLRAELDRRGVLRSVAASGLLAAALGGVNAAASGLMLVIPFLFLLTHPQGRRRIGWWVLGVLAGALWWLLPLLVLGGYGYPFLDFIETASMTTAVTSTPNVLRGNSDWIAYILDSAGHPTWQSGWTSAQSLVSIVATSAVAGIGLVGVARLRSHLGRFALLSVLVGTVFMTIGHHGVVGSPVAGQARALLDGSLAPLRNVHKADALIRLPVVLGLAVVLDRLRRSREVAARLTAAALVVLVAAAMTPIWQGRLADSGGYRAVPVSWSVMAHRIDAAAERAGGSTLLFPNARTATYDWGTTSDDPMSALAASPLVFRAAAPLGEPGATRMLDTADQLASSGEVQPGLAAGLARMGIARIVVRHSIASTVGAQPWSLVEATLRRSPGFAYAGSAGTGTDRLTLWTVSESRTVAAYARDDDLRVVGGPESIFDLATVGALAPDQGAQIVGGTTAVGATVPNVVTDSLRWRSYNNGVSAADGYSPTLTGADRTPDHIGARDLPPGGDPANQPVRELIGMSSWSASSSGADPTARTYAGPGAGIAAAFDDDPDTAWRTGDHESDASLSFTPTSRTPLREVDVDLASGPGLDRVGSVRVSVGAVHGATVRVARGQTALRLRLPRAATGAVRIDLKVAGAATDPVIGLTRVSVPGQQLGSIISLPGRVDPTRTSVLLRRDPREHSTAATQGEDPATLRRRVTFSRSGQVVPSVWVRSAASGAGALQLACGQAGVLRIGTSSVPLRLTASAAQVAQGGLLRAQPCATSAAVAVGPQTVSVAPGDGVRAELVYLRRDSSAGVDAGASIPARAYGALRSGDGTVRIGGGGARVVALTEGYNRGWHASLAGRSLPAVRVDGWRQGFVVPAGAAATLHVTFGPTRWQRAGLIVGALAVLALAVLAVGSRRRGRRAVADGPDVTDPSYDGAAPGPTRVTVMAAVLSVGVGVLMSGLAGVVVGALCLLVPRRLVGWGIGGSMAVAGVLLASLGVVDQRSVGAILGQLAGTVTACLLARCLAGVRTGSGGGPAPAPAAPPGPPTPAPPRSSAPSPRPASS
ncbi:alpha-(1-_3)-arabinofuranosyltransferase domain-containing protein [Allobranchiibius huperziae]|uniref:Arabinofuranan 3-O-arabinosyltransferase n=1 Tax=Allobranchiibius huperziae TaxID=1874116 RepID=A0A853DIE1_9MICO|nr:arabinofuranan 3-O-arabinosyltransferase [Allobranchiibius huperziae]